MKTDISKILENCREGIVILDAEKTVYFKNANVERLCAGRLERILNDEYSLPRGNSSTQEVTIKDAMTVSKILKWDSCLTYSQVGPLYLIFIRDITQEKQEWALTQERQAQGIIDKLKNDLISIVSHELRTPLAIAKSSVENLKDGVIGDLSEKQAKVLKTTLRNLDRLGKLIQDFLDLSRLEAGVAKIHRRKLDLTEAIERVADTFHGMALEKKLKLTPLIEEPLSDAFADAELIAKALGHLLHNAMQFARSTVTLKAVQEKDFLKISVLDDGPGIPREKSEAVFQKLTQVGRSYGGAGYKGTGLGLTICHDIVAMHQGEIWIESDPGCGTCVNILLPVYRADDVFTKELEAARIQADANKNAFSLLSATIRNYADIKAQCTPKDIEWMRNDVVRTIDKILRQDDIVCVMDASNSFNIILNGVGRQEAISVSERIHRVTKDCFCPGQRGRIFVDLSVGLAMYPADAAQLEELEKVALDAAG